MTRRYATEASANAADSSLTERDRGILGTVSELRFVSGDQLKRLHFIETDPQAQARAARRALIRLVRLDVLARLPRRIGGVRAGSAGFVYHLGAVGHRLAVRYGWQPERRRRRSDIPGTAFLNHSLAVAELHTLLVEADRSRRFELLELSAEPSCWRSYGGVGAQRGQTLKPDSYVRLEQGEFEDSYFIEVDRGTEGSKTIDRKLKEYVAYAATGIEQDRRGVFPRVLWLAPDAERVAAIEAIVGRLSPGSRELFAVAALSDAEDVVPTTSTNTLIT
ncbi:MAG: replication-relaxation family protein [Solirubrobacterales bacterium]